MPTESVDTKGMSDSSGGASMTAISSRAIVLTGVFLAVSTVCADAKVSRRTTAYDGAWDLSFVTRAGTCESSTFQVNIERGIITHPNLVRFRGTVSPGGAARASVAVSDKSAAGTGRLSLSEGRGSWSGYSGTARCSGHWVARKI